MNDQLTSSAPMDTKRGGVQVFDLSHPLVSGATVACSGHPSFHAHLTCSLANGDLSNVHTLTLGTHTGTHIDAPFHFFQSGQTIDKLDLSLLTASRAVIIDVRSKGAQERITWDDVKEYEERMTESVMVLFCTGWCRNWSSPNYDHHPFLDPEVATKVVERGVKVIGVETMSPDPVGGETGASVEVHRIVLGQGGIIVENLCGLEAVLESGIPEEEVRVSALPLNLVQCDGSPVRAVAWFGGNNRE
ncbi:hypothetical protein NLI96_g6360 [Meripilus lineatus]|uniref:Cyclase n=1 Tax=Meripilus lineatus TaxID=2056292 RepID=A0AAD5YD12_9APHY|nr:hypothetical protein NLI96_g6360 [Physisporinus lineatus]